MTKRIISVWLKYLKTDWICRRQPHFKELPFVMAAPERGRMVVQAVNPIAESKGIYKGMVVADCRAILPSLQVLNDIEGLSDKLLKALAEWSIRYTPVVAVDPPDGLILDVSGCPHLWGGEKPYLKDIITKFTNFGYHVRVAIADTAGAAWAVSRYGQITPIVDSGRQLDALLPLPPVSLRLEPTTVSKLEKLGLYQINSFIKMPRSALRRRFGQSLLTRLDQALGQEIETIVPVKPIEPYQERLPSLEPIRTATGIEIGLKQLIEQLCNRLEKEGKGIRKANFKCYRIDGNIQQITIGTNRPSRSTKHIFKLFEPKIANIEPAFGIELFLLEAPIVEDIGVEQDMLWHSSSHDEVAVAELVDRITGKLGDVVHRYLPAEHHMPERSIKIATSFQELPTTSWRTDLPRPIHLLAKPEPIQVTVAIPDYPPILFHYNGNRYTVKKADGPERIEEEWWLNDGLYRDYYCVEDENGGRYWLFRLGSYNTTEPKWFLHGFFA